MADPSNLGGGFYPLAFYATKRLRAEWLDWPDAALLTLAETLPGKRLVVTFGGGRLDAPKTRRRGAQ